MPETDRWQILHGLKEDAATRYIPTVVVLALIERLQQAPQSQQIPVIVLTAKTLTAAEQALLKQSVRTQIQKRALDRETLIQELRGRLQTYRGPTAKGSILAGQQRVE